MHRARRVVLMLVAGVLAAAVQAQDRPVMQLELPTLDGERFVRLDDFAGQAMLLNFWGSECPPCVREMPLLFAHAGRTPGLSFLGIAVDTRDDALRFLGSRRVPYPQLLASTHPEVVMRRFGNKIGALPFTVVLNRRHQICTSKLGEVDAAWLDAAARACADTPEVP